MLRQSLNDALKTAMLGKDSRSVSTIRLILAALKDRDIAARSRGVSDGIGEEEILQMLQSMIKQRRESIALYEKGGRDDLVQQESEEITVIEKFLPEQMDDAAVQAAVDSAVAEVGASGLKDMGKVIAVLKEKYTGQMDFGKASGMVKAKLS